MRRMREAPVMFWIAMGPIAGLAGYGVWHVLSKKGEGKTLTALSGKKDASSSRKAGGKTDPAEGKSGSPSHGKGVARVPASAHSSGGETRDGSKGHVSERQGEGALLASDFEGGSPERGSKEQDFPSRSAAHADLKRSGFAGTGCAVLEFAGEGPALTRMPKEKDWVPIRTAFHQAKADLEKWVVAHGAKLPEATREVLKERIRNVRIQRPPTAEEPDLAWRGMAAVTHDERGVSLIRVGGGFLRTFREQPVRAKFELTRLVSQVALSPCELNRAGLDGEFIWKPLAGCMGIKTGLSVASCQSQVFSEAGWAISTALAHVVSPSGCEIPGMASEAGPGCLKQSVAWLQGEPLKADFEGTQRAIASESASTGGKH
jgi:hypothetical protein